MISFRDFLRASGRDMQRTPYPWQEALATRLAAGEPPRAIVVPTGGGKTVTIEALLWALAMQADRAPHERTVGVRTVWAIDRRILVDEVYERATHLAERLLRAANDSSDDLNEMAWRLRSLTGSEAAPLQVTRWRGGLARESRAHHPFQAEIITSTVAQIGSRLLFRGYGVGERSLALEAGLAAIDTTICLDEAHLAEPFRQTVDAIRGIRASETTALPGLRAITLTATPVAGVADAHVHGIGDPDRVALRTRLTGEKLARLVEPASERVLDQVAALLDGVERHLEAGAGTVACVVNTVRTAIEVDAGLARRQPDVERALLIGPQRPVDRKTLLERHRGRLFEGETGPAPLVVVATQTFEVGIDADVDALVTQSASATAIVQRFGRLNRAGRGRGAATIVRDTQSPLYADDEGLAWEWLRSREQADRCIDMSVEALMDDDERPRASSPRNAPGLTDDVLALLVQTAPRPAPMADPDVEVFLRGADERLSNDVGLCWRCDLRIEDASEAGRSYREALLRLVPPEPEEIVTVSIARTHALLRALQAPVPRLAGLGKASLDGPDVEGGEEGEALVDLLALEQGDLHRLSRLVLRRGRDQHEVPLDGSATHERDLTLRDLRPGDVLVLPTSAGGYANGALAPASRSTVEDMAVDLRLSTDSERPPPVRLTEEALHQAELDAGLILRQAAQCEQAGGRECLDDLCRLLGLEGLQVRRITDDAPAHFGDLDDEGEDPPAAGAGIDDHETPDDHPLLEGELAASRPAFVLLARAATSKDEVRSARERPPTLDGHAIAVASQAKGFVSRSGLPEPVAAAVVLAARAHDHGKGDRRIQAFFNGGVPAFGADPIAKSVFGTADVQADRAARVAAGLPRGLRHEIASVAALADAVENGGVTGMPVDVDLELALHLVATHHGLGRPFPRVPSPSASAPRAFAVAAAGIDGSACGDAVEGWDEGAWLHRFLTIIDRYGPWGTAYLEALLMLADRSVSAKGD
jgi:CRISPR-associated endonuclease/helicase Cas3